MKSGDFFYAAFFFLGLLLITVCLAAILHLLGHCAI